MKLYPKISRHPLGVLKSLLVISDWIHFADPETSSWSYRNQSVTSVDQAVCIFIPVDFNRLIENGTTYLLLYGAGIYWTQFVITQGISTDSRFLSALVVKEEKWLNNHFNTEPFVFPPDFPGIVSEEMQEFPFAALQKQNDTASYGRRAFGRGLILAQLVFPFKEPLTMLRKAAQSYETFDSPNAPMRVLVSGYGNISNEIIVENPDPRYELTIPGIRRTRAALRDVFPSQWSNKQYLQGIKRETATIAKDFAYIGAPMILD
ncbi:MAG: hypothetical protein ACFFE8_06980 [Candidatus Heimdallarchaeota archaeon]